MVLKEKKPLEIPWPGGREVYNYREEPVGKCCATFSLDLGGEVQTVRSNPFIGFSLNASDEYKYSSVTAKFWKLMI